MTALPAEDIYAIFAGWHAEHAEILRVDWKADEVESDRVSPTGRCPGVVRLWFDSADADEPFFRDRRACRLGGAAGAYRASP